MASGGHRMTASITSWHRRGGLGNGKRMTWKLDGASARNRLACLAARVINSAAAMLAMAKMASAKQMLHRYDS